MSKSARRIARPTAKAQGKGRPLPMDPHVGSSIQSAMPGLQDGVIDSANKHAGGEAAKPNVPPNEFTTSTRLSGYGIKFAAVPIVGLSAVSEDFRIVAPIVGHDGARLTLGDNVAAHDFIDADGDGRRMVYLADLSVGEKVILPTIVDRGPAAK